MPDPHAGVPSAHSPPGGTPPPSGFRVALATGQPFPTQQAGQPASFDADGRSPVFIGSAIIGNSVHPCKIAPHLNPPVRVGYGGREVEHQGRYDLLPFTPFNMEWVPTSKGKVPSGRRPVEGGYEDHGGKLYHALVTTHGVQVPGKTGEHLGGANCAFGGSEIAVKDGYSILCVSIYFIVFLASLTFDSKVLEVNIYLYTRNTVFDARRFLTHIQIPSSCIQMLYFREMYHETFSQNSKACIYLCRVLYHIYENIATESMLSSYADSL
ncbi:hypothetical protein C8Q75DRAFT_725569 [Abortiporus biennis]|nr:hypothetical protein C8Q75DRAFT_725569 [Abortiporus biennis]